MIKFLKATGNFFVGVYRWTFNAAKKTTDTVTKVRDTVKDETGKW